MHSFIHHVKVYIDDTDYGQCVYHANYLKFMEHARTEWLNSYQISHDRLQNEGVFFVIRQANIHYKQPARVNEILTVTSSASIKKNTRLIFKQRIAKRDNPSIICCEGDIEVVCVNIETKPIKVPDCILALCD